MKNLYDIVSRITQWARVPFAVEEVSSGQYTMAANGAKALSIPLSKAGYIPIGIVGQRTSGTNSGYSVPTQFSINDGELAAYITNRGNVTGTWETTFKILWLKSIGGVRLNRIFRAFTPCRKVVEV